MNDREKQREKLIELIKGAFDKCCSVMCENCEYEDEHISARWCQSRMFADYLKSNGVTVQRWIPATESLPEEGVMVLGVTKRGAFTLCRYNHRVKQWQRSPNATITHWMPLPELPKGE